MVLSLVRIGNSRGIRLPKNVIEECAIKDKVEALVRGGSITIRPLRKVRQGWGEQMKSMHERGEDRLLLPEGIDATPSSWEW
jgi:antitoxin MazE